MNHNSERTGLEIAVIGMAGKLASSDNLDEFWNVLSHNIEDTRELTEEELIKSGVSEEVYNKPCYIRKTGGILKDREYFDGSFFGYTKSECEVMSPQCRLAHEYAYAALEDGGYNPFDYKGKIGNYWGSNSTNYWEFLVNMSHKYESLGDYASWLLSSNNFLSTRISYKLNLKGPSINLNTACSTSLVAIDLACYDILTGKCHMAMVGSVSVSSSPREGYEYMEGMINSSDGHCRAFDADASGTTKGEGVGVVILKRLEDALNDNDHIYAVIKGTAVNNDGNVKVGYTVPSVLGEMDVINKALSMAEVDPKSISYIETHGTGTKLGDSIELEALNKVFRYNGEKNCEIGSVKTNIGHLDIASGMAGFIKTVLSLNSKMIPASINYSKPNPNLLNSQFYVNTELHPWINKKYPLRAGISSFGIGGTNAHVIVEEAPEAKESLNKESGVLICLSAKSESALSKMESSLLGHLMKNAVSLQKMSYTLLSGRRRFAYRKMFICESQDEAIEILKSDINSNLDKYLDENKKKKIIFMFPGQGFQYIKMAHGLYTIEPVFKNYMDKCFKIIEEETGSNLKSLLFDSDDKEASRKIIQTVNAQPIIFSVEYSLAMYLISLGIIPDAMIGHSLGEYVAAAVSGVFTLEDALKVVIFRGEIMQSVPSGVMLCVNTSSEILSQYLNDKLSLVAVNSSDQCVISGKEKDILEINEVLNLDGHRCTRLKTSHAFHSYMMDPVLDIFVGFMKSIKRKKPKIPYISNVTGSWITYEQISADEYWARHIRSSVQFKKGIETLLENNGNVLVEIGAGRTLNNLARKSIRWNKETYGVNMIKSCGEEDEDYRYFLQQLGFLWLYGVEINWNNFFNNKEIGRISLPTYPYERKRYWIDYDLKNLFNKGDGTYEQVKFSVYEKEKISYENEMNTADTEKKKTLYINENTSDSTEHSYFDNIIQSKYIDEIADIFKIHFGVDEVDIHQNFFDMGANSLDMVDIKSKIEKRIQKTFSITELYNYSNIYKLCIYLKNEAFDEKDINKDEKVTESKQEFNNNKLAMRRRIVRQKECE